MATNEQTAGSFYVHGPSEWRVTSPSAETAMAVGAALNGALPHRGSGSGWEVICQAAPLLVRVATVETQTLTFQLANLASLGSFHLDFAPWDIADVLGTGVVATLGQLDESAAVLDLRAVYYTTRGGMLVRYAAATLTVS